MRARKSVSSQQSMCVQPTFIIGTYDEDGNADFAPITWLSVTSDGDRFLLVVSMFGTKKTKMNVKKTGRLSANLVSTDMLPLVDYFGSVSGHQGLKTVTCGESDTFFCEIKNVQISEDIDITDGIDLTCFDPVVYSGHYHSLGDHLGKIGDYL